MAISEKEMLFLRQHLEKLNHENNVVSIRDAWGSPSGYLNRWIREFRNHSTFISKTPTCALLLELFQHANNCDPWTSPSPLINLFVGLFQHLVINGGVNYYPSAQRDSVINLLKEISYQNNVVAPRLRWTSPSPILRDIIRIHRPFVGAETNPTIRFLLDILDYTNEKVVLGSPWASPSKWINIWCLVVHSTLSPY
eukprot:TRINITY_DN9832_c0_g1_i2.p1 TRINITY_DN9832_c0_g1~~TRINITY_DN9832_c0_g1_i2.p1  ORF type:complete len:196 (+),score=32.39 TRINITY_DN9832_c0_g1_i2:256-843(+)